MEKIVDEDLRDEGILADSVSIYPYDSITCLCKK